MPRSFLVKKENKNNMEDQHCLTSQMSDVKPTLKYELKNKNDDGETDGLSRSFRRNHTDFKFINRINDPLPQTTNNTRPQFPGASYRSALHPYKLSKRCPVPVVVPLIVSEQYTPDHFSLAAGMTDDQWRNSTTLTSAREREAASERDVKDFKIRLMSEFNSTSGCIRRIDQAADEASEATSDVTSTVASDNGTSAASFAETSYMTSDAESDVRSNVPPDVISAAASVRRSAVLTAAQESAAISGDDQTTPLRLTDPNFWTNNAENIPRSFLAHLSVSAASSLKNLDNNEENAECWRGLLTTVLRRNKMENDNTATEREFAGEHLAGRREFAVGNFQPQIKHELTFNEILPSPVSSTKLDVISASGSSVNGLTATRKIATSPWRPFDELISNESADKKIASLAQNDDTQFHRKFGPHGLPSSPPEAQTGALSYPQQLPSERLQLGGVLQDDLNTYSPSAGRCGQFTALHTTSNSHFAANVKPPANLKKYRNMDAASSSSVTRGFNAAAAADYYENIKTSFFGSYSPTTPNTPKQEQQHPQLLPQQQLIQHQRLLHLEIQKQTTYSNGCLPGLPKTSNVRQIKDSPEEGADAEFSSSSNSPASMPIAWGVQSTPTGPPHQVPSPHYPLVGRTYSCQLCQKSYVTSSGLSKHRQVRHNKHDWRTENVNIGGRGGSSVPIDYPLPSSPSSSQLLLTCRQCDKAYTTVGALKMHIRTHTLPCQCPVCGKSFSRPWLLQGHLRTHTGERPFGCPECGRAFADRSNLRAHLQTHSDSKKYVCRVCHKTFSRLSLLLKHQNGGEGCGGCFGVGGVEGSGGGAFEYLGRSGQLCVS